MQWDGINLDTHFTQNVYFLTPNSETLAKALNTMNYEFIQKGAEHESYL